MEYKDNSPLATVDAIRKYFFERYNLSFTEKWHEDSGITPSLTLLCNEIGIIVNGKGMNREYALASAYGEFCERVCNGVQIRFENTPCSMNEIGSEAFDPVPQKELGETIHSFLELETISTINKIPLNDAFSMLVRKSYFENSSQYPGLVFKNASNNTVLIPLAIADYVLGTNGMAAGNTYEEAFVQGFSEVLERRALADFCEGRCVPSLVDIDDFAEDIELMKAINKIKSSFEGEVLLLTFEATYNYPIACVLLFNKKERTLRYRFGAHCRIQYALERCLTEMFQGASLTNPSHWHKIRNCLLSSIGNVERTMCDGSGVLSRFALLSAFSHLKVFKTLWSPSSNLEAAELIKCGWPELYVKRFSCEPLYTLQIYIPKLSIIRHLEARLVLDFISKIELSALVLSKSDYSCVELEAIDYQLRRCLSQQIKHIESIGELIVFACPVQKNYLRRLKPEELQFAIAIRTGAIEALPEKASELLSIIGESDDAKECLTLYAEYTAQELSPPIALKRLYSSQVWDYVEKKDPAKYFLVHNLNYCRQCSRKGRESCINLQRKRVSAGLLGAIS